MAKHTKKQTIETKAIPQSVVIKMTDPSGQFTQHPEKVLATVKRNGNADAFHQESLAAWNNIQKLVDKGLRRVAMGRGDRLEKMIAVPIDFPGFKDRLVAIASAVPSGS